MSKGVYCGDGESTRKKRNTKKRDWKEVEGQIEEMVHIYSLGVMVVEQGEMSRV